jgi:hypothetical protein
VALTKKISFCLLFLARALFNIVFEDLAPKLQAIRASASAAIVNKSFGNFLLVARVKSKIKDCQRLLMLLLSSAH